MVQHEMDPMAIMLIFSNHVDSISYTNIICNKRKEDRAFPLRVKTHSFHALRHVTSLQGAEAEYQAVLWRDLLD